MHPIKAMLSAWKTRIIELRRLERRLAHECETIEGQHSWDEWKETGARLHCLESCYRSVKALATSPPRKPHTRALKPLKKGFKPRFKP